MLNNISVMGRLTKKPELHKTNNDISVCNFTIACDRDFGEKETDFIDCIAWRNTADFICKYFDKGSLCSVNGRLQFSKWTDNNGNNRRDAEILVEHIYFGGSKKDDASNATSDAFVPVEDDEGGLPF